MKLFLVFSLVALSSVAGFKLEGGLKQLQDVLAETKDVLRELKKEVFHQESEDSAGCEDNAAKCTEWKTREGDNWGSVCSSRNFLRNNCKKTCDLCEGSSGSSTKAPTKAPTRPPTEAPTKAPTKAPTTENLTNKPTSGGSTLVSVSGLEECTESNKGHCECADTSDGFQTYVFKIDDTTRCFTVFHPPSRASEKLPVVLSSQCYGKDRLMSINMKTTRSGDNIAAVRYGFARIGLSTPDGHWTFGNNGIVNDETPMPCSDSDSKDIPYVKKVFEFIKSNPAKFDSSRVFTEGFSQNSMFSAYIGFCFSDDVVGIWQGGSGLAYTGELPNLPGCQGQCTASAFAASDGCKQCIASTPCTECQYWPIYPCYQPKRPVIDCIADYKNDYIASSRSDSENLSTAKNMYETLKNEGHSPRLLRFKASDDGSIPGGHQNPKNTVYWQVGCLGITSSCSPECEASFEKCIDLLAVADAADRVNNFESCIEESKFVELTGCTKDCSPTFDMLKESEEPVESEYDVFGAIPEESVPQPSTSKCSTDDK